MGHWNRSREIFKKHYDGKYDNTLRPPAWMIFETTTFGTVSKFFSNLKADLPARNEIVCFFGFKKSSAKILVSWLQHLNLVRNICAHHSRLFSRSFVIKPMIPMRQPEKWVNQWPAHDRVPLILISGIKLKRWFQNFVLSSFLPWGFPRIGIKNLCFISSFTLFLHYETKVSRYETKCFPARNYVFLGKKLCVSR